jgi:hypothetical protein
VFASNWEEPAPAAPVPSSTEVFVSNWEEPAPVEPTAPSTEVFVSSWEEPAPAAPAAPSTEVFASNWEEPVAFDAVPVPTSDAFAGDWGASLPAPQGRADERVELSTNAEFLGAAPQQADLPTLDVGDVSVESEAFEIESGPAAGLINNTFDSGVSSVEEGSIELASNADFLDHGALQSAGESWQRSGASVELTDAPEEDIIQGTVVEEEAGWDTAIPAIAAAAPQPLPLATVAPAPPRPLATRVATPIQAQPMADPVVVVPVAVQRPEDFDRPAIVQLQPVPLKGLHRVILHTTDGQVKRGSLKDPDLGAQALALEGSSGVEAIGLSRVKAVFFMLAPGARSPAAEGQKIRVTFRDGRQVAGFSRDHGKGGPGFFVVPADNRTNTERIYIYRHGVQAIALET